MGWEVVWLTEYRTWGYLIKESAYTARIAFKDPNTLERVEEDIENEEWTRWEEHSIDYDTD